MLLPVLKRMNAAMFVAVLVAITCFVVSIMSSSSDGAIVPLPERRRTDEERFDPCALREMIAQSRQTNDLDQCCSFR